MLEQFPGYETRDLEFARDVTLSKFNASRFEYSSGASKVLVKANWAEATNVKVITAFCSAPTFAHYNELTSIRQYFEIGQQGRLEFQVGTKTTSLSSDIPSMVVPSSVAVSVKGRQNQHVVSLRIENHALTNLMRALLDDEVPRDVSFSAVPKSGPWQQNLKQSVIQFMHDLDLIGPNGSVAARDVFAQALMVKFLFCNSNVFSERLQSKALAPSLGQLKRIEDFIESNWHRAVDIEELSRLFNISTRSIFRHFKTYRGLSPLEYIKGVRLKKARKLLENDDDNRGVMAIAMQCGFQSLGHFSRDYREAFLELPSDTLRRARLVSNRAG